MTKSKTDARVKNELLTAISSLVSVAESSEDHERLRGFLPLREHARVLDPKVLLVVGDKGAGKSMLFRMLQHPKAVQAIAALAGGPQFLATAHVEWLVGFALSGRDFPPPLAFQKFAPAAKPVDLQRIWLALLVRCLADNLETLSSEQRAAVANNDLQQLLNFTSDQQPGLFDKLDQLDNRLVEQNRWLTVCYDEIDVIASGDWSALTITLQGLVQFWASYARRWQRIRPKIFLRRDLFDRVALVGPDVSKISAQRVELLWSGRSLYTLLVKQLMNQSSGSESYPLRDYVQRERLQIPGSDQDALGWCPEQLTETDHLKPFIERLCGENMGATANKGKTYNWIINHLQDSNGRVLPRSLLRLFSKSAQHEETQRKAEYPCLLHYTSLRHALRFVSDSRVEELTDEFPWIKRIRQRLKEANPQVPVERPKLERQLSEIEWDANQPPPENAGRDLLRLLIDLGIFYARTDDRIDARDLYCEGFGLKRKGGVQRPYTSNRG